MAAGKNVCKCPGSSPDIDVTCEGHQLAVCRQRANGTFDCRCINPPPGGGPRSRRETEQWLFTRVMDGVPRHFQPNYDEYQLRQHLHDGRFVLPNGDEIHFYYIEAGQTYGTRVGHREVEDEGMRSM
jgi:hypothetical protein